MSILGESRIGDRKHPSDLSNFTLSGSHIAGTSRWSVGC